LSTKIGYFVNKNKVQKTIKKKKTNKKRKNSSLLKLIKLKVSKKIPKKEVLLPSKTKLLLLI
jgi:hypothetical protein